MVRGRPRGTDGALVVGDEKVAEVKALGVRRYPDQEDTGEVATPPA
jgi:hypothetical protein